MKKYFIYWSPLAEETYLKTLGQILDRWTINEVEDFEVKVEGLIEKLKTHKRLCPLSEKQTNLRRCVISPQTSIVYRINDNVIELVAFFDNRVEHQY
ncbi:MAG: type II toxin-antitoxin system RelE/ParE family toxin [Bacteroidetes bacterium]|nr:MAG: type II toxin-antitoxin system RelE/ParE family toxin [Bacteroidota bacterium]